MSIPESEDPTRYINEVRLQLDLIELLDLSLYLEKFKQRNFQSEEWYIRNKVVNRADTLQNGVPCILCFSYSSMSMSLNQRKICYLPDVSEFNKTL